MKSLLTLTLSLLWLFVWLFAFTWQTARAANTVVGNGSPASCNEAAFDAALTAANSGGGTITFNCGPAVHIIPLTLSKTVNLANVTIDGGGRIILKAGANERHFFAGPVTFRLQNIILQEGDSLVNGGSIEASGAQVVLENVQLLNNRTVTSGGAIYCYDGSLTILNSRIAGNTAETGGAIYNDGCEVVITNTTLIDNQAIGAVGRGGAIENAALGTLTARGTRFQANNALDGGGLYNASGASAELATVVFISNAAGYGGGVENSGTLNITQSLFDSNNASGSGGGLWNISGTAVIEKTTFTRNVAFEGGGVNTYGTVLEMRDVNLVGNIVNSAGNGATNGGGLYHAGGTAFLTNATISGNVSMNNGGGIYQASDDNLTLTNVTIANNLAANLGGGLYHYGRYAVLTNTTLANNRAGIAGNAIYEDSPQTPGNPGMVQLVNSVIYGYPVNCDGAIFQSLGHNLSQGSCASLNALTDQDAYAGNLLLGGLMYNGGSFVMQTILPQQGSPLINAGDPAFCNATDQREAARVGTCDLGAVEYGAVAYNNYMPVIVLAQR